MKVLILTFDPPENIGGIENRGSQYTRELTRDGHIVTMMSLYSGKSFGHKRLNGADLLEGSSSMASLPASCLRAVAILERGRIDGLMVLSGSQSALGVFLLAYARLTRRTSMAFYYGRDLLYAKGGFTPRLLGVLSFALARKLAVNSEFTRGLLPSYAIPKSIVIYPSVDADGLVSDAAPRRKASGKKVLFVGRLVPRKAVDVLLRAFKAISLGGGELGLDVVGDGPEKERLVALSSELKLLDKVHFLGSMRGPQLNDRFAGADVLVLPSRSTHDDAEGFGTVFIEAAVFGTPGVGTRTGGIPEAVVDGQTGILVPQDDVEALARAISLLLTDTELRDRMAAAARERASRFNVAVATRLIEEALGR